MENTNNESNKLEKIDWLLRTMVISVNKIEGLTLAVTLNMSGFLVSGSLVSGKAYFEDVAKSFSSIPGASEVYSEFGNKIYSDVDGSNKEMDSPQYFHLIDVQFYHPGNAPIPNGSGTMFRGKLSEVSGFILGSLKIGKS